MNQKFGFILYEQVQPMDVIGPWEIFSIWKKILNAPIDLLLIAEAGPMIECDSDIYLKAHCNFANAPALDYLIVPGGRGRFKEVNNQAMLTFLQTQATHCQKILSVCTGAFLLHAAGLLKDHAVTTYWRALPELQSQSDIAIVEERIVKSNKIWTAGGISSGIDLALELIADIVGTEVAGQVQLLFEYFPQDKLYCSAATANTLPPYNNTKASVATYIKKYLANKK